MMTYGDGVADVDLAGAPRRSTRRTGRLATVTAVQPPGRFGALEIDEAGTAGPRLRREAARATAAGSTAGSSSWSRRCSTTSTATRRLWEQEPLEGLAARRPARGYRHRGFWQPMDTLRDKRALEELWESRRGAVEDLVMFGGDVHAAGGSSSPATRGSRARGSRRGCYDSGAEVTGFALDPPTDPSLFDALELGCARAARVADVRDRDRLAARWRPRSPTVVFHLAAQPLVRRGYAEPLETFETNVMGTVNVLEAVRACDSVAAVVVVTSDKCYDNDGDRPRLSRRTTHGRPRPVQRQQGLRGALTAAYRASFFDAGWRRRVASAAPATSSAAVTGRRTASSPTACARSRPASRRRA